MSKCKLCSQFFVIQEDAADYEEGKGNCVLENEGGKGKYWISKPRFVDSEACSNYKPSMKIIGK